MSAVLGFIAIMTLIVGRWFAQQGLAVKPWLQVDGPAGAHQPDGPRYAPAQIGLGVFLAVAGSLFALLITGYLLRSEGGDWRAMPLPWLVWPNTLALVASGAALEWALSAARAGALDKARRGVLVALAGTALFLVGQFVIWRMPARSLAGGRFLFEAGLRARGSACPPSRPRSWTQWRNRKRTHRS